MNVQGEYDVLASEDHTNQGLSSVEISMNDHDEYDEVDIFKDGDDLQPWGENDENDGVNIISPMKVNNWRQLFDQEELNLAYKQSIKAYKKESARASESKGEATNVNESMRGMVSSDNQSTFENLGTLQMTKQSNDQVTEQITDS